MKKQETPVQLNRLAEQIGKYTEHWGFKKIHGMIWTHIYLSTGPISAQELISRLNVSKALVSLSIKDLLQFRLILQTDESKNKKNKFYVANLAVSEVLAAVVQMRELVMLKGVQGEFENLAAARDEILRNDLSIDRIANLSTMISGLEGKLNALATLSKPQQESLLRSGAVPALNRFAVK